MRTRPAVAALWLLWAAVAVRAQGVAADPGGHWEGAIQLPGAELGVKVDLELADGAWHGSIDIPLQGAQGLTLEQIEIALPRMSFRIAGIPGSPTFEGRLAEGEITGSFHQGGAIFPFRLGREEIAEPPRPQEPQPPFPYESLEVSYPGPAGKIAGTLTLPEGEPIAAVLLISGSGPQNRDEEVFGHRPFQVIADHLSREGIAVLRVDDRGVGGSAGDLSQATTRDFVEDARAGIRFLRAHSRLPADRIGLLGHSEGGIVAPQLAGEKGVAFLVLVAPPAVPGRELLARQRARLSEVSGEDPAEARRREEVTVELLRVLESGGDPEARRAKAVELLRQQLVLEGLPVEGEATEQQVEAALEQLESPWLRAFLRHDPRPALARVEVPVLALFGALDLQVDPEQNQPELEKALRQAENPDVTVRRLPSLNHLMQTARTGHPSEYAALSETFSPAALELISGWIAARFAPPAEGEP